jgi:hypothetical protein
MPEKTTQGVVLLVMRDCQSQRRLNQDPRLMVGSVNAFVVSDAADRVELTP